jgi:hypothetical protein
LGSTKGRRAHRSAGDQHGCEADDAVIDDSDEYVLLDRGPEFECVGMGEQVLAIALVR